MHRRRWLTRALAALIVPAVTVPALTTSATAATGAQVPTIGAVAKIYPHLKGGTANVSGGKVYGPGTKCGTTKVIKGASQRSASYSPDYTSGDPSAFEITGARPSVSATGMKFATKKSAIDYLRGYQKYADRCPTTTPGGGTGGGGGSADCTTSMKKIRFSLGDERWGYQIRSKCTVGDQTTSSVFNSLFARKGRFIVYTSAFSMDATAPSITKSVAFTKLALQTVS